MLFTKEELIKIIEDASGIYDRLEDDFSCQKSETGKPGAEERLNKWCQAVAKGDLPSFERRLNRDGLTLSVAKQLLTGVTLKDTGTLPAWVSYLQEMVKSAGKFQFTASLNQAAAKLGFLKQEKPLPFEELLIPFLLLARDKIREIAGSSYHLLNESSHYALERMLLKRLATIMTPTLFLEFSFFKHRAVYDAAYAAVFLPKTNFSSRGCYETFIKDLQMGGLLSLFREYPVLARLAAGVTEQ